MGHASKCDKCGKLFESRLGCLTLSEVCVANGKKTGEMDTWSDVDFCPECSEPILDLLMPALNEIDETLAKKKRQG